MSEMLFFLIYQKKLDARALMVIGSLALTECHPVILNLVSFMIVSHTLTVFAFRKRSLTFVINKLAAELQVFSYCAVQISPPSSGF